MATIRTKGKGKNRKVFPINNRKKVSVRSVSLNSQTIKKINKEQGLLLNQGETANFSKALNQIVIRAKRDGIPIYDTHVNVNKRRKPFLMWIVKHPEKHDKVKGSETIVMADDYGQAIDDFITTWNKDPNRNKKTIGQVVVQGTAKRDFRFARGGFGGNNVVSTELKKIINPRLHPEFHIKKTGDTQGRWGYSEEKIILPTYGKAGIFNQSPEDEKNKVYHFSDGGGMKLGQFGSDIPVENLLEIEKDAKEHKLLPRISSIRTMVNNAEVFTSQDFSDQPVIFRLEGKGKVRYYLSAPKVIDR